MAKGRKVEEALGELGLLASAARGTLVPGLARYLAGESIVVAKAAKLLEQANAAAELEGELAKAFERFLAKGGSTDRGCLAKFAIANALYLSNCTSPRITETFLTGARWVQKEPAYGVEGGSVDTAAELRGICGMGLVRVGYPRVMEVLVNLLADACAQTRILAVRALAYSGQDSARLLLRHKVLVGDRDERVIAESISAIGQLGGIKALEFLRHFLAGPGNANFSAAAMAIGEMRHADALEALLTAWRESMARPTREALLLPIALSRLPAAIDFLLSTIADGPETLARGAVEAMAIFRHDSALRGKITAAVETRADTAVTRQFARSFPAEKGS